MDKLGIVTSSAIAALTLLTSNALAQQGTLRQQLIGPWNLISCTNKQESVCISPSGSVAFTQSGRYIVVLTQKGRPEIASIGGPDGRSGVTYEDYKAIAQGLIASFGTWSVDEARKTITLQVEGDLFPNFEGSDIKGTVSVNGDEMKTSGEILGNATWRRNGAAFFQPVSR
jgi:hypothetical protein